MILAVTPGDPLGIGPEITAKAIVARSHSAATTLLCVGARKPFEALGLPIVEATEEEISRRKIPRFKRPTVWLHPAPVQIRKLRSQARSLEGYQSGWSIETATRWVQKGYADALVTGPISKERLQKGGFDYPGHTEFLAKLCGVPHVTMMLANEQLRVTLVTTHIALNQVSDVLNKRLIVRTLEHTAKALRNDWGIKRPRIAVAALNPHAGEQGLFGNEEMRIINPALRGYQARHVGEVTVFGPLPADTLFAKHIIAPSKERYDAVICMYHDQGLIPVKLLDFPRTVNVTLGLPIIRTSVDHGVGFDIVGRGIADPSSLQAAIRLAEHMVTKRKKATLK